MKKYYILFILFFVPFSLMAQSLRYDYVIISEIMYDSPLNEQIGKGIPYSNGEFIKIYNVGNKTVNLAGWQLKGGGITEVYTFPQGTIIPPAKTSIIAYQYSNSGFLIQDFFQKIEHPGPYPCLWDIIHQRKIILSNGGETLSLLDPSGKVVDYITYDGTSNKSKPNRLVAENEDWYYPEDCCSLQRSVAKFDNNGCAIFDPLHWKTLPASPDGQGPIEVSFEQKLTTTENFILETTFTGPNFDQHTDVVTYYDGFGRPSQIVEIAASPVSHKDIVSIVKYDNMDRSDSISYLPYVSSSQCGSFRIDPISEQKQFYTTLYDYDHKGSDCNYAYARKEYDMSGLGLTLKQGAAGSAHQLGAHPVSFEYGLNNSSSCIRKYEVDNNSSSLVYKGDYPTNTLTTKITSQDADQNSQHKSIEYYDPNEKLVAKEEYISAQDRRITYYVYDELDRLRYTIPPSVNITASLTPLNELVNSCFYKEYDEYGRIYKEYIPGASYSLSLYDSRGRLAMTQAGKQREKGKWTFIKYNDLDLPVLTGEISGGTEASHKTALATQSHHGEYVNIGSTYFYSNECYPIIDSTSEILAVTLYNNYDWQTSDDYHFRSELAIGNVKSKNIEGLITGKIVKVVGSETSQWLTTAIYYDDKYQKIQTVGDLYPSGKEVVSNAHDFSGNITEVKVRQEVASGIHEYHKWFDFDTKGRLLRMRQQITDDTNNGTIEVVNYTYDEMGRTINKKWHNSLGTQSYSYDISGKNTRNTSEWFSSEIQSTYPTYNGIPRYDGKPAATFWTRPEQASKGYVFTYDPVGQLSVAQHVKYTPEERKCLQLGSFNEKDILYDLNGNILQMFRTDADGGVLHDLTYRYTGNQLTQLKSDGNLYSGYTYDASGNMTYDPLEDLHFEYNNLNLPSRIFGEGGEVRYIYNSEGQKLATLANGSFTYYRNVMIYGGSSDGSEHLLYMLHPEGVVAHENGNYTYQYHLKDYIGNVRSVLEAQGTATDVAMREVQTSDYYPFGISHSYNNLHKNRYLFSGKELQDQQLGKSGFLGLYDFGARVYNPMLGRWFNIDPALQTTNPYLFCGNAPMAYVDQDGEFFWFIGAALGALINGMIAGVTGGNVPKALLTGAISGALGGLTSAGVGGLLASGGSGFIGGSITGAAGGFVGASSNAWMNGASFANGSLAGLIGAGAGGLTGGLTRGISDSRKGFDFLRGSKVGSELMSSSPMSDQTYDSATLKDMAKQAKADANDLWGYKTGRDGLIDISTTLDNTAKSQGYSYKHGGFNSNAGYAVDGFTVHYSSGNSKVFLAPNTVAARTGNSLSSFYLIKGPDMSDFVYLSARYVSTLGHELIHVHNWFNGGYLLSEAAFRASSENAAYEFTKHVWKYYPSMVREFDNLMQVNGWTTPHPTFRNTPIFSY